MSVITYTRPAKCKDCLNLKYLYVGKRKVHKCIIFDEYRRLNDIAKAVCIEKDIFVLNENYYPEKL